MAGIGSEDSGVGMDTEGISTGQNCQAGEALVEWRSSEQVENGITSTSPPYWDADDDDDGGLKPFELYGKYTWKIEKFSQINKRELRSNAFEVGGYKWYILIYPQGCDVCNHISLFLCVANHDKLLPGWSHFAQFTIAVVNKDPKKSKYSDTLHRFWKKEHDWGWKKFMELSKVTEGFIDSDTLIIKAQVQVIREKADRPFRCLDCQYRRELVRVYLTNVEQICRRFLEERRGKLGKLIEDKARWSSFCAFWLGIDESARSHMSRVKTDVILKVVVKQFFIEKEVTSTLVMDSLYSGLMALEGHTKGKKVRAKLLDAEEMTAPIVRVEKDMFVLVDDLLLLLERAAMEPLPPKDEKGPQNRTKDGNSGDDLNMESTECDERRLTELGRRTMEILVLAHIFSNKIEVSYQEAVALKRQEELIREEEAAWQAESEQKAKRAASEKEKKLKKKQAKQKRMNRKGKGEKSGVAAARDKHQKEIPKDEKKCSIMEQVQSMLENPEMLEDGSDMSDSVDEAIKVVQPDSEDRDASPVSWDTDTSEVQASTEACSSGISVLSSVQNGMSEKRNPLVMDDSSSTCSTDSVPSVVMNGPYKGNSFPNKNQNSPGRGKNQRTKVEADGTSWSKEMDAQSSGTVLEAGDINDMSGNCKAAEFEPDSVVHSLQDQLKWLEPHVVEKEEVVSRQKKLSNKDQVDIERLKEKTAAVTSSPRSPSRTLPSIAQQKSDYKSAAVTDPVTVRKTFSNGSQQQTDKAIPLMSSSQATRVTKPENPKAATSKPIEKPMGQHVAPLSRASSAPLVPGPPGPRPTAPVVSMVQTAPILSRSMSAAGRLSPDTSPANHCFVPPSYRNVMMGNSVASSSAAFTHPISPCSAVNSTTAYPHQPAPISLPQNTERIDLNSVRSGFRFGTRDMLQNGPQWIESSQRDASRSLHRDPTSLPSDSRSREPLSTEFPACTSGLPGTLADEFPHLDIINDLLDDEQGFELETGQSTVFQTLRNNPYMISRQFSFPGDTGVSYGAGSSSSSCRYERTQSYNAEGFQRFQCSSDSHFDLPRDFVPQASQLSYANGQIDGLIPNQWSVSGSDLSLLGMRNSDGYGYGYGYPYYNPGYPNLACDVNGYTIFRPSNGH